MSSNTERWISMEEITEHLGVSRESVVQWISKKNLPAHKLGKLWKFKLSEVDEWIKSGEASKQTWTALAENEDED